MVRGFFQIPQLPEYLLGRNHAAPVSKLMLASSTDPRRFPEDLLDAVQNNAAQPGALTAMLHWYRALLRGGGLRRQLRIGFPVIETPTLLLWGDADTALSLRTTHGTGRYVRHLTFVRLRGVSHWVQQDATAACNRHLREFLGPPSAL